MSRETELSGVMTLNLLREKNRTVPGVGSGPVRCGTVRSPLVEGRETGCDDNPLLISWCLGYDEEERDEAYRKRNIEQPHVFPPFVTFAKLRKFGANVV